MPTNYLVTQLWICDTHLELVAEFLPQLLEVVVMFRDDVFGNGFVAAVGFIEEHSLLEEPTEERPEQFGLLDAGPQLAQEFTAHITITLFFNTYSFTTKLAKC